jgi:hypothetical protein
MFNVLSESISILKNKIDIDLKEISNNNDAIKKLYEYIKNEKTSYEYEGYIKKLNLSQVSCVQLRNQLENHKAKTNTYIETYVLHPEMTFLITTISEANLEENNLNEKLRNEISTYERTKSNFRFYNGSSKIEGNENSIKRYNEKNEVLNENLKILRTNLTQAELLFKPLLEEKRSIEEKLALDEALRIEEENLKYAAELFEKENLKQAELLERKKIKQLKKANYYKGLSIEGKAEYICNIKQIRKLSQGIRNDWSDKSFTNDTIHEIIELCREIERDDLVTWLNDMRKDILDDGRYMRDFELY